MTEYQTAYNRGYLLGLEHGLMHPEPTCREAFEGALKDIPDDEREYWRERIEKAIGERES